jgi:F0F1-type ATP synthase assembly protein I
LQPFYADDAAIQVFFPDRYWATAIPVGLIVVLLCGVSAFVGNVLRKQAAKKKKN